jgi:uncharacterized membrane protein
MLLISINGPIIGAGFGLPVFSILTCKKSLKNLAVATFCWISSFSNLLYISPFKEVQPELLSRTSLIIYDILIAV